MKKKKKAAGLFFAPFGMCFILFWLVPFVYGCYLSVCNMSLTRGNQGFSGLENYIQIFFNTSTPYGGIVISPESSFRVRRSTALSVREAGMGTGL